MKLGEVSVGEVYSPPRVTARSTQFGVKPCFALDLTEVDPDDGKPWDFSLEEEDEGAREAAPGEAYAAHRFSALHAVLA
eukprot:2236928-Heterocapsa_arctica.AAC.1